MQPEKCRFDDSAQATTDANPCGKDKHLLYPEMTWVRTELLSARKHTIHNVRGRHTFRTHFVANSFSCTLPDLKAFHEPPLKTASFPRSLLPAGCASGLASSTRASCQQRSSWVSMAPDWRAFIAAWMAKWGEGGRPLSPAMAWKFTHGPVQLGPLVFLVLRPVPGLCCG